MGGRNHCGHGARRIIYRRLYERDEYFPGARAAGRRERQYAKSSHYVVRTIHVRVRDRLVAAAGGDYRSGSDGEEEDLVAGSCYGIDAPHYDVALLSPRRSLVSAWCYPRVPPAPFVHRPDRY